MQVSVTQLLGFALLLMIGCADGERNASAGTSGTEVVTDGAADSGDVPPAVTPGDVAGAGTVLFIGTSLTAGFGLPEEQAFPALIAERIASAGLPYRVVNAGVSGETSAGALGRIEWLLQQEFAAVVLETGANDMLRGTDPAATRQNIGEIVRHIRDREPDAPIILAGMLALPNLGTEYGRAFEAIYSDLAEELDLILIPFLLEGVAGEPDLNQSDGIHPTAEGQRRVADTVWEVLEPVLREDAARRRSNERLTADGWGPLRIGMTRAEVEAAAGPPANPDAVGGPEPESCDEFQPRDVPPGMLVMIERDTLTRITLIRDSPIRTTAGVRLRDSEPEVVAAHGGKAEVGPHKYLPTPAAYITAWVTPPDAGADARGFVYETDTDRRVTHIHAGGPSIQYVEGCL